jgi:hypothetical protein
MTEDHVDRYEFMPLEKLQMLIISKIANGAPLSMEHLETDPEITAMLDPEEAKALLLRGVICTIIEHPNPDKLHVVVNVGHPQPELPRQHIPDGSF